MGYIIVMRMKSQQKKFGTIFTIVLTYLTIALTYKRDF